MNKTTKVFSFAIAMFALIGLVTFPMAEATYHGYKQKEGCTPGFYKANEKKHDGRDWPMTAWDGMGFNTAVSTTSSLSEVGIDAHIIGGDTTLIEALKFKGGDGDEGAERIYLRAAVAAFLNANHPDVNYHIPAPGILPALNGAHDFAVNESADGFRTTILAWAEMLDEFNNGPEWIEYDFCPLSNSGKPLR